MIMKRILTVLTALILLFGCASAETAPFTAKGAVFLPGHRFIPFSVYALISSIWYTYSRDFSASMISLWVLYFFSISLETEIDME